MSSKTIHVDYLARVEGEGSLWLEIRDDEVRDVKLKIFEPPRFFEAFLRGRKFTEAPDITARICGICPIAYLLGASQAMEDACGITVSPAIRDLRRLIYCGEWIESHVLHIYMLHAPDFLGYEDAIQLAKDHPEIVKRGLRLKKIGNDLMTLLGGREIHPINLRVGGFYRAPAQAELRSILDDLKWGLEAAVETVRLVAGFEFPDFEQDYTYLALRHPEEYAIHEGRLVSNNGVDTPIGGYDEVLREKHLQHTTALVSYLNDGRPACVGPLARYTLNYKQLTPAAKQAAQEAGLGESCHNPFQSIIVRAVETVLAYEEAVRLVENYQPPDEPFVEATPKAGTGFGCTEAPRGICYHRYTIDDEGVIQDAKIVSPTAVNQAQIEADLRGFVADRIDLPEDQLQWQCEQAIRNYDPCISCSCHFLKLHVDRR